MTPKKVVPLFAGGLPSRVVKTARPLDLFTYHLARKGIQHQINERDGLITMFGEAALPSVTFAMTPYEIRKHLLSGTGHLAKAIDGIQLREPMPEVEFMMAKSLIRRFGRNVPMVEPLQEFVFQSLDIGSKLKMKIYFNAQCPAYLEVPIASDIYGDLYYPMEGARNFRIVHQTPITTICLYEIVYEAQERTQMEEYKCMVLAHRFVERGELIIVHVKLFPNNELLINSDFIPFDGFSFDRNCYRRCGTTMHDMTVEKLLNYQSPLLFEVSGSTGETSLRSSSIEQFASRNDTPTLMVDRDDPESMFRLKGAMDPVVHEIEQMSAGFPVTHAITLYFAKIALETAIKHEPSPGKRKQLATTDHPLPEGEGFE